MKYSAGLPTTEKTRMAMKAINLTTDFDPELPEVLLNDTQIQQSVLNLCINAADAIASKGEIAIRTFQAQQKGRPFACIEITDNGPGMSEEVQEKTTQWLWHYNHERPNMALGGLTPKQKLHGLHRSLLMSYWLCLTCSHRIRAARRRDDGCIHIVGGNLIRPGHSFSKLNPFPGAQHMGAAQALTVDKGSIR